VKKWEELIDWANAHSGGKYLYRGQGDASPIIPKIGRKEYSYHPSREKELFTAFKSQARPYLAVSIASDWEWLALAQHHGAPTRLTDWSTSPLVAAWFAVSSYPIEADARIFALDIEGDQLTSRIDLEKGEGENNGAKVTHPLQPTSGHFLLETSPVSSRITTQRGLFMLHGNPESPLSIDKHHQFRIPKDDRSGVMEKLSEFGVEASHIFPDLDGLCKSLDWRLRLKKPLGLT